MSYYFWMQECEEVSFNNLAITSLAVYNEKYDMRVGSLHKTNMKVGYKTQFFFSELPLFTQGRVKTTLSFAKTTLYLPLLGFS